MKITFGRDVFRRAGEACVESLSETNGGVFPGDERRVKKKVAAAAAFINLRRVNFINHPHYRKISTPKAQRKRALLAIPEPAVVRKDHRLRACPNAELVKDIRDVIANGLFANRKALPNFCVPEALCNQRKHFPLTPR